MSVVGNLSRHGDLREINAAGPDYQGIVRSAAVHQANAVSNLGFTATAAQMSAAGLGTMAPVLITDVTSYAVLAENSGKVHIIPELTGSCTFTLPTGAAGLMFLFMSNGIAVEAQNWVFTAPAGVFYRGGVQFADTDEPASPALLTSVFPNGSSHITLTVNVPSPAGTFLMFVWDGTRYVINGSVYAATVPAFS